MPDAVTLALLAAILAAIAMLLVLSLASPREVWDLDRGHGVLSRLGRQKERVLRILKDLDAEREMGTIEEEEYRELRTRYRLRAAEVLRELDRVRAARVRHLATEAGIPASLRNKVERLVKERRRTKTAKRR